MTGKIELLRSQISRAGLPVDIEATYQRARVDHWVYDTEAHRLAGWVVLLFLLGGGTASLVVFIRRTRDDGA